MKASLPLVFVVTAFAAQTATAQTQELFALARGEKVVRIDGYQDAATVQLVELGAFDRNLAPVFPNGIPTGLAYDAAAGDLLILVSGESPFLPAATPSAIFRYDLASGATTFEREVASSTCNGLALRSDGWMLTLADAETLLWLDPAGGEPVTRTLQMPLEQEGYFGDVAFDERGGLLVSEIGGATYSVDPVTGAMQAIGTPQVFTLRSGVEVDLDGTLYLCSGVANLDRYDVSTGVTTSILGSFNGASNLYALAFTEHREGEGISVVCDARPHVGLERAVTSVFGVAEAAANDVTIVVDRLPQTFGLFLTGRAAAQTPLSFGTLCIAQPLQRYTSPVPSNGVQPVTLSVDLQALPDGSPVLAGEQHLFQFWFRDFAGGAAGSNFSPAVSLTFR